MSELRALPSDHLKNGIAFNCVAVSSKGDAGALLTQSEELAAEEAVAESIASILETRFGVVPEELVERLKVTDLKDLRALTRTAVVAESLAAFSAALAETEPEM